jgi:hypothetical protein
MKWLRLILIAKSFTECGKVMRLSCVFRGLNSEWIECDAVEGIYLRLEV